MIATLLSATAYDALRVARDVSFFAHPATRRTEEIHASLGTHVPKALLEYLTTVSASTFMEQLRGLMRVLALPQHERITRGAVDTFHHTLSDEIKTELLAILAPTHQEKHTATKTLDPWSIGLSDEFLSDVSDVLRQIVVPPTPGTNAFLETFCRLLTEEVADALDRGTIPKDADAKSALWQELNSLLTHQNPTAIATALQTFIDQRNERSSPIVQIPIDIDAEMKKTIRAVLRQRFLGTFPVFRIEPSLAGGIRVFAGGEMVDYSWIQSVQHILHPSL